MSTSLAASICAVPSKRVHGQSGRESGVDRISD